MKQFSRRGFIRTSSGLLGVLAISDISFENKPKSPLLSFSTLGCPKWNWPEILSCASNNGYEAIEIRGILGELDLTKCPIFSSKKNIDEALRQAQDKQIKIIDLGSSANLHYSDEAEWQKSMDSAKKFIELAHQLHCPYVRVFPNKIPEGQEKEATIERVSKRLSELGKFAQGSNVSVLMETHGDGIETSDIKKIMELADNKNTGLVWDVFNMWSVTKVPPAKVYPELKKYIKHTHLKDGKFINGEWKYVLFGRGECPIFEAVDLLRKDGYSGYYCFEWEKLWHPDIAEPEVVFPDYATVMRKHFNS